MHRILWFPLLLSQILSNCPKFRHCSSCNDKECTVCDRFYGKDKRSNSETKGQCIPCQSISCLDCLDDAQICVDCFSNKRDGDSNSLTYWKCIRPCTDFYCWKCEGEKCLKCESGYGVDENGKCRKCADPDCNDCDENYKICTSCSFYCGKGPDLDTSSKTYGQCIPPKVENCKKAEHNDANICDECNSGFYLNDNKECVKCGVPHCSSCSSQDQCSACESNYYIRAGECYNCPENCERCNRNECISCANGFYKDSDNNCVSTGIDNCQEVESEKCTSCNSEYGYDSESNQCVKCKDNNCKFCHEDYRKCGRCIEGYLIDPDKNCVSRCEVDHCLKCSIDNSQYCETCEDGYGGSSCTKCPNSNCLSCSGYDLETCNKCAPNYCLTTGFGSGRCVKSTIENCKSCKQYDSGAQSCYECMSGYYNDDYDNCIKCIYDCETCAGHTGICTSCKNGEIPDYSKGSSSYGMCSGDTNDSLGYNDDGGIPEWAVIVIIVACCVVAIVIISVIICCICKKKKAKDHSNDESP